MDSPQAYIPIDRRLALAEGRALPERTRGAALFADISGFTPLTEMLARVLGPKRGAEELTVYLNQIYDALIAEVHRYGGSVLGFSGDAITCWFDDAPVGIDPSHQIDPAAARAATSAVAMQAVMGQFANLAMPGGGSVSLAMKAAVAAGGVRRFIVGDPGYLLIDVMAGATLERLAAGEHQANKGDVILDSFSAEALGARAQVTEWRVDEHDGARFAVATAVDPPAAAAGWRALAPGELGDEQARPWLLAPVYSRLRSGGGQFLAELRTAAALFLRFTGIDYDRDEAAPDKLNGFIRRLQQIFARYDGSLLQLTIGDKGSYLYGAFGSPVSHEDDVDRAALAALELQQLPNELAYLEPLQIGVTFGRMRVGAYGSVMSRTYGVLGDAVNLSARLMQASTPGQILVNDTVRARAGDYFEWESLPAIRVKGKSEPVALNRLVSAARHQAAFALEPLYPRAPIGRAALLAALDQRLAALSSGQGQVLRLVGSAGMGKSHLAAHLLRAARGRGIRAALGICQSHTQNTPYLPWRQVFGDLLGLDGLPEPEQLARLAELAEAQPAWALRLPLLSDLLGLPLADNPTTATMEREIRQKALFSLLVELVQHWAGTQPLLLLVDNAQWMDEASQLLAQALARQAAGTAPAMLAIAHRPPMLGGDPLLPELEALPYAHGHALAELAADEVDALLRQRLDAPVDHLIGQIVHALGRGNPFFINELLEAMRRGDQFVLNEEGGWSASDRLLAALQRANVVAQQDGEWHLKPQVDLTGVALDIPDSIQKLILSRLDRLPESPKLTLKVGSVIGHIIDLALVAQIHPEIHEIPELEIQAELMEVEEVIRGEVARKLYAFRHQTTQEVVYETLLFGQRRQLHRSVAAVLADESPEASAEIAHHAFLGESWPLALRYNLLAGEQARRLYANQQGVAFFQRALQSAEALPPTETAEARVQIHLAIGELLVSTGKYESADRHLQAGLELARERGDAEAQARGCRWLGRSHELRGEFVVALRWLEQGFDVLGDRASLEGAEISLIAGLICIRQGRYDEARRHCERSLSVAQILDAPAVRARTYNLMGIDDLRRGESAAAIGRFAQALAQYEQLQNVYGQATSHNLLANGYFQQNEWTMADRHYRRSRDLFLQIGDAYNQVLVNNNLGGIALKQGRSEAALGYYQRALRLLEQIGGSLWVIGCLHMNAGHVRLRLKQLDQAEETLRTGLAYFEQSQQRDFLAELYGYMAEVAWLKGDLDSAHELGRGSLDVARELEMPREAGYALRILGEIARSGGDLEQADAYFTESYETLAEAGDDYERAKVCLAQAHLYANQGRAEQALASLGEGEEIARRLGMEADLDEMTTLRRSLQ